MARKALIISLITAATALGGVDAYVQLFDSVGSIAELSSASAQMIHWNKPNVQRALTHFSMFLGIGLVGVAGALRRQRRLVIHGSARWADDAEIKDANLLNDSGVFLGTTKDGDYLRHDGPEHIAVVAPSRSGKGAGIVIPTLLTFPGSVIVHDLKEENWKWTSGARERFGRTIRFSPTSKDSARFNPLREVRLGLNEVRDVQNIADMIVDPDGSGYSDHWIKTGHSLLVGTILHILYVGKREQQSLSGVASFLSQSDKTLIQTLKEMQNTSHILDEDGRPIGSHPVVVEAVRDMLNKADNERSGVLSTAKSFLDLYRDPIVAWNTAESDFRIADLLNDEKPVSLYLVVPPPDIPRLKPLTRLMINQFCRRLTEELDYSGNRHKLLLLLDEFPALGRLEFFETALGFLAGYGIRAMLVNQSINQLRKTYGANNSILDNTHVRVFYAPNTIDTAEYISKTLGSSTDEYESSSQSRTRGSLWHGSESTNRNFVSRALLTPREVMELPQKESIIFVGNSRPIRARKIEYFRDESFKDLIEQEPPRATGFDVPEGTEFWRSRIKERDLSSDDVTNFPKMGDDIVIEQIEGVSNSSEEDDPEDDDGFIP